MADDATTIGQAPSRPRKKRPPGVLLFLPAPLNRGDAIQWLKRIHAWTGFWGALAFLLLGTSGLLLNHRSILKIDTGEPKQVMEVMLPVGPDQLTKMEDLGAWAQKEFGTSIEPRAPRNNNAAPAQRAEFMGREVEQAPVWRQAFTGPNGVLTVEYSPGSTTVKATQTAQTGFGVLKNLHKGTGLSWPWVLFIDTIAGGLIAMSLTGALLWSRLHGPRLAAIGIVGASLGLALFAAWPSFI